MGQAVLVVPQRKTWMRGDGAFKEGKENEFEQK